MDVYLISIRNGDISKRYTATTKEDVVALIQNSKNLQYIRVEVVEATPPGKLREKIGAAS